METSNHGLLVPLIRQTAPSSHNTSTITTTLPREIGRYIPTSSGLACRTWGWSSGARSKASGRTAVWAGSIRTRFLCRSRLIHTTLGVMQKPAQGSSIWLCGELIVPVRKAIRMRTCVSSERDRNSSCIENRVALTLRGVTTPEAHGHSDREFRAAPPESSGFEPAVPTD